MSILTPEEQVGFYRQKGIKVLLWAGFMFLFAILYFFWFGPWLRDAPGGTSVNALLYAYYELFGIPVGALVLAGLGVIVGAFSYPHFSRSKKIQRSLGNQ